jgi:hypothetical protein
MKVKVLCQGLILFCHIFVRYCADTESNADVDTSQVWRNGEHVLHNGRIVSQPVSST